MACTVFDASCTIKLDSVSQGQGAPAATVISGISIFLIPRDLEGSALADDAGKETVLGAGATATAADFAI